jgi:hypothetical protein
VGIWCEGEWNIYTFTAFRETTEITSYRKKTSRCKRVCDKSQMYDCDYESQELRKFNVNERSSKTTYRNMRFLTT